MLEKYIRMFANLRTDSGRERYPEITYHRAPHKPFLLLPIIDLIAPGRIAQNLIEPSCQLVDTFNSPSQNIKSWQDSNRASEMKGERENG
jgi:putative restriction endonuclease